MDTIDPMVSALISLCKSEGGEKFVADKAKVSAENLAQITKGVKLPSGNPRGVGPGLRAKISAAYPGWLSTATATLSAPSGVLDATSSISNHALAHVKKAQAAINIDECIDGLMLAIAKVNPALAPIIQSALVGLCADPRNADLRRMLRTALEPPIAHQSHTKQRLRLAHSAPPDRSHALRQNGSHREVVRAFRVVVSKAA